MRKRPHPSQSKGNTAQERKPHHLIDKALKQLTRQFTKTFFRVLKLEDLDHPFHFGDTAVNTPELKADNLIVFQKPDGTPQDALLIEFQLIPRAKDLVTWHFKALGLQRQMGIEVALVVVYLCKGRYQNFPDSLVVTVKGKQNVHILDTIHLWEDGIPERIRSGELGELAPLLALCERQPTEATVREGISLIKRQPLSQKERIEALETAFLVDLRYFQRAMLEAIFEEEIGMKRGQTIIDKWRAEAIAEGLEQGRAETRRLILHIGQKRFGEPSEEVMKHLESLTSIEELEALADRLMEVETWQELFA